MEEPRTEGGSSCGEGLGTDLDPCPVADMGTDLDSGQGMGRHIGLGTGQIADLGTDLVADLGTDLVVDSGMDLVVDLGTDLAVDSGMDLGRGLGSGSAVGLLWLAYLHQKEYCTVK